MEKFKNEIDELIDDYKIRHILVKAGALEPPTIETELKLIELIIKDLTELKKNL